MMRSYFIKQLVFLFIATLLVSIGESSLKAEESTVSTVSKGFRIATYNINYGNPSLSRVLTNIKEADPDILCLQEVNAEAEAYLREHLSAEYPYMDFHTSEWAGGFGFISRRPLRTHKYLPPKHGFFGAWIARVEVDGKKIDLINVHLQLALPKEGGSKESAIVTFLSAESTRQKELQHIFDQAPTRHPTIILGDFNSPPFFTVVAAVLMRGYRDSFEILKEEGEHPTWRANWGGRPLLQRIDYIFHEDSIETTAAQVISRGPSDHFLVVSTMRWR